MSDYRLFYFRGEHIVDARSFSAGSDAVAIAVAEDAASDTESDIRIELWCGQRRLRDWSRRDGA